MPADGALVTARAEHGRRIVAACSAEARAAGAAPGQPLAEARVLAPGLIVADADEAADHALLMRIAYHAARRWTPLVETVGTDGLVMDVAASAHLFGGESAFLRRAARLVRRRGLAVRGAAAGSVAAAHALAHHAQDPLCAVAAADERAALAPLPPAALRIDDATVAALQRLGFDRLDTLLAAPAAPFARRFGAGFAMRRAQMLGERAEPVAVLVPPGIPVARRSMLEPIVTPEAIALVIEDLAADLCKRLETESTGVRRALLVCRRIDAQDETATLGLARPTRDARHLAALFGRRIETIDPGFGIETMTLAAVATQPLPPAQVAALGPDDARIPDLVALVDRLANRFGGRAVHRIAAAESDSPVRSAIRIAPLAPATGIGWRADWPRPPRLLRRAEQALVTALLPDHGPRAFTWRGRRYRVIASDGPERLFGEWWRGGRRLGTRDYFQVEVEDGGRYWLYRRGDGRDPETGPGDWFIHGAFG